jgi:hypothetical protein
MSSTTRTRRTWSDTPTAAALLGVSKWRLYRAIKRGEFKRGEHYRDISDPNASRADYQFNVEAINQLWALAPCERPPI